MRAGNLIRVRLIPVIGGIIKSGKCEDYEGRALQIRVRNTIIEFSITSKKEA